MDKPETIENRWDILYRDYPEVYEAFASASTSPNDLSWLTDRIDLTDRTVLDVGAGTGTATAVLAKYAKQVVGIEPESSMRAIAIHSADVQGVGNVTFLPGSIHHLGINDHSVDVIVAMTTTFHPPTEVISFVERSKQALKPGGWVVITEIAPGWYGGELDGVIGHAVPEIAEKDRILQKQLGFAAYDWEVIHDYRTTENAVKVYGFIFGKKAIAYLRETGQTKIRWRMRAYFLQA